MAENQTNQESIVSKERQAEAILRQRTQDFLVHTDAQAEPSVDVDEKTKNDYKLARDRAAAVKGFLASSNNGLTKSIEGVIDNQQVLEGLPVEGVIEYLDQEQLKLENVLGGKQAASQLAQKADRNIDIKEPPLTDEQKVALESYRKLMSDRASIYGHSESYFPNVPVPRSEGRVAQKDTDAFYYNEGTPAHRRVKLEAKIISEDPTRASRAGTEEERQGENFQKGIDAMDARRMYRYAEAKSALQEPKSDKTGEKILEVIDSKTINPDDARDALDQTAQGPTKDPEEERLRKKKRAEARQRKKDRDEAARKKAEDEKKPIDPSRAVVPYSRNTDVATVIRPNTGADIATPGQGPADPSREVAPYVPPVVAVPPRDGNEDAIDAEWRPVNEGPVRIDGNRVTRPPQLGSGDDLLASQQIIDGDYRVLDDKTGRIDQPKPPQLEQPKDDDDIIEGDFRPVDEGPVRKEAAKVSKPLQLKPPTATSGEQPPKDDPDKDKAGQKPPEGDADKDKEIAKLTAEVDALKKRLDELERKMAEKDAEIDRLKKENERLQKELDEEKRKNKAPAVPVAKSEPAPAAEAASFVVGIDNQNEDIEKRAREVASERLRGLQNEKQGNILKRALNGARYKIFGEAYRQKYIREARSLMVQNGTTAVEVSAAHTFALASADVIKRFQSDREAAASRLGLLEESQGLAGGVQEKWQLATGDTRTFLMDKVFRGAVSGAFANEAALQKHLTDLMKQVSDGTLVVSDQVKKDLTAMFGKDQNMSGKTSEAFASNILTMAEKVKASAEFKRKGLDAVAERVKFVIGKSAWAAQTEASYNAFDKTLMKMNKSRIGRVFGNHYMFTAATVGAMTVITKSVLGRGANLIFPVVGGAVVGGAVAGLQKGFELRTDRLTHQAEMAYGRQYEPGAKNREKMDQYIYSMATVSELLSGGGEYPPGNPRLSIDQLTSADLSQEANKKALMVRVAEIQGRMDFSIQNKVDLIKYEHRESVAQGRLELTRALVRARKALEASGTPTAQLTRPAIEAQLGVSFDTLFTNEKKAKDQTFNHYVRGEVAKRALVAAGLGIGVGTAIGFARENGLFDAAAKAIKDAEIGALRGIDQGLKSAGIDTSGIKGAAHAVVDAKNTVLHGAREVAAAISPSAKIGEIQVGQHLEGFFDKGPRAIGKFMGELKGNDLHLSVAGQPDTVLHLVNGKIDLSGQAKAVVDALKQSGFNVTETSHVNTIFDNISKTFTTENVGGIPVKTPDGLKWIADARGGFDLVDKTDPTKVIMKGVNFVKDAQGAWTVNHADIVGFPGQNAQVLSETLPGVPKSVDILGANGEWAKHSEKLAKIDWYANNTQYSDHNELRAYTYKLGKKIIIDMSKMQTGGSFQNGLPSVDVPSVVKNGKAAFSFFLPGLKEPIIIPSPLDGKLILDPDDMKTMVKFPNGTEMPLGKLTQMLIDEKEVAKIAGDGDIATEVYGRQSIFKLAGVGGKGMGVMSVGRLVKNAAGESEWHSFAALRGSGVTDGTIDMPSTDTMPRIEIPKLAKEVKDVFAGAPPNVEVADKLKIPIGYTPIPFLTNPLENLKDEKAAVTPQSHSPQSYSPQSYSPQSYSPQSYSPQSYSPQSYSPQSYTSSHTAPYQANVANSTGGYGQVDRKNTQTNTANNTGVKVTSGVEAGSSHIQSEPISQQTAESRVDTTRSNEELKQSIAEERKKIRDYLAFQNLDKEMSVLTRELAAQMPPMHAKCEASICIPAAYSEHRVIYNTLKQYANQKFTQGDKGNDSFEIVVFVNGGNSQDKVDDIEKTMQEIARFKNDYPNIHVIAVSKSFEQRQPIGTLRKALSDAVLTRSVQRTRDEQKNNLLLISNDADVTSVEPNYLDKAIQAFDTDKNLHLVAGKVDYTAEDYVKNPLLHAARRMWQYIDIVSKHDREKPTLQKALGCNSIVRAGSYADVSGYQKMDKVAEDLNLGSKIVEKYGKEALEYRKVSLSVSPRRDIDALAKGIPLIRSYDTFGPEESLREAKFGPESAMDTAHPDFIKRLAREASYQMYELMMHKFWKEFDNDDEVKDIRSKKDTIESDDFNRIFDRLMRGEVGRNAEAEAMKIVEKALQQMGVKCHLTNTYDSQNARIRMIELDDTEALKKSLHDYSTAQETVSLARTEIAPENQTAAKVEVSPVQSQEISFGRDRWNKNERPPGYMSTTKNMDKLVELRGKAIHGYLWNKYQGKVEGATLDAFWQLIHKARSIGLTETEASRVAELSVKVNKIVEDEIEQTLNATATKVEVLPVYSNPEKGKPIESAIVSAPRVRFIPDVHGGSDRTKAEGRSPLAPFRANSVNGEILVSLGDIADRGPQSWEAAQELKGMVEKGEAIHVLGNHDMFAIAALLPAVNGNVDRQKTAFANWLANGGTVTVRGATGIDVDAVIQSEMARQNANRDTILRNLAFGGDAGSLINVFDKVRQDKRLLDWAKHMQQHGKMYAVANGGMAVHAGVPVNPDGSLLSVKVNGKDLSGLDYLDAIQAAVRSGDANTILGLNNGDKTDMNNFMWVREPYQNVIANRNAAHNMREALNQQVGARGGKVEFLVHGHDKHKGGTGFQTTSTNQDRIFFIDTSHSDGGEPAALMASLSSDGKRIDVAFKNPETNANPKNEEGKSISMEEGYDLDQALPVQKKTR